MLGAEFSGRFWGLMPWMVDASGIRASHTDAWGEGALRTGSGQQSRGEDAGALARKWPPPRGLPGSLMLPNRFRDVPASSIRDGFVGTI